MIAGTMLVGLAALCPFGWVDPGTAHASLPNRSSVVRQVVQAGDELAIVCSVMMESPDGGAVFFAAATNDESGDVGIYSAASFSSRQEGPHWSVGPLKGGISAEAGPHEPSEFRGAFIVPADSLLRATWASWGGLIACRVERNGIELPAADEVVTGGIVRFDDGSAQAGATFGDVGTGALARWTVPSRGFTFALMRADAGLIRASRTGGPHHLGIGVRPILMIAEGGMGTWSFDAVSVSGSDPAVLWVLTIS